MHSKTKTLIVILATLALDLSLFGWNMYQPSTTSLPFVGSQIKHFANFLCAAFALISLKQDNAALLVPFMIAQLLTILQLFGVITICLIGMFDARLWVYLFESHFQLGLDPNRDVDALRIHINMLVMLILCFATMMLSLSLFQIVRKCYRFLSALHADNSSLLVVK